MSKFIDLTGMKFHRLTVIERAENDKRGRACWLCRCECGNLCVVCGKNLLNGNTKSCGCYQREKVKQLHTTHGMCGTSIYTTWQRMINRCENSKAKDFDRYGGRGIKVCERWHIFQNFYDDVSILPHFGEKGYTLDRIDNDGDYCPENVRWADINTQNRNTRQNINVEYNGIEMCLTDAAAASGIEYQTLRQRYWRGDRGERLFCPVKDYRRCSN